MTVRTVAFRLWAVAWLILAGVSVWMLRPPAPRGVSGQAAVVAGMTVTPDSGLHDGDTVAVRGTGFDPARQYAVALCRAGSADVVGCHYSTRATVAGGGALAADLQVGPDVVTYDFDRVDCRLGGACEVVVLEAVGRGTPVARVPVAFAADPGVVPGLTVEPDTDLAAGQTVEVRGTGFGGARQVELAQCPSDPLSCRSAGFAVVDADGTFTTSVVLTARVGDAKVDCRPAPGTCALLVGGIPVQRRAFVPLAFDPHTEQPPPALTLVPGADLVDGQTVRYKGAGFVVGAGSMPVAISQCRVGGAGSEACTPAPQGYADSAGGLAGEVTVSAVVGLGGEEVDCRVTACELRAAIEGPGGVEARAPLDFRPDGPLLPMATLQVSPSTGLRDGQAVDVHIEHLAPGVAGTLSVCPRGTGPARLQRCVPVGSVTGTGGPVDTRQLIAGCPVEPDGCEVVLVWMGRHTGVPVGFVAPAELSRYHDRVFAEVETTKDVVYGHAVGAGGGPTDLMLDLYQPKGDTAARRPAIVYIHGGYFAFGDKSEGVQAATELARRGYVVVSIDYRLYPGDTSDPSRYGVAIPAALEDAHAAVRWLRSRAGELRLAPTAIGSIGYSAGAVTSLFMANQATDSGDSGNPGFPADVAGAVSLSGVSPAATPGAPRVLMFHGDQDTTVTYQSAVDSCQAMRQAGRGCELVTFPGIGHNIYDRYVQWMAGSIDYFAQTVVPAMDPTPPPPDTGAGAGPGPGAGDLPPAPPAEPVPAQPHYTG